MKWAGDFPDSIFQGCGAPFHFRASGLRLTCGVLFFAVFAIPAFALHWTVTELDGEATYVIKHGDAPKPIFVGLNLPQGAYIRVTSGRGVTLRSGEEREFIGDRYGTLLRRAPGDGYPVFAGVPSETPFPGAPPSAPQEPAQTPAADQPEPGSVTDDSSPELRSGVLARYQERLQELRKKALPDQNIERSVRPRTRGPQPPDGLQAGASSSALAPAKTQIPPPSAQDAIEVLAGRQAALGEDSVRSIPRGKPAENRAGLPEALQMPGAGGASRDTLQILWPPNGVRVVAPPSIVRYAASKGAVPSAIELRTAGGAPILRIPLGPAEQGELTLPELALFASPGESYRIAVEWKDSKGTLNTSESGFEVLAVEQRRRLGRDLLRLHDSLGSLWNEKEGILLRAVAFAECNCQGEATELLLRYRALAPGDPEVHYILSYYFKEMDQPARAEAALSLAQAMR